MSARTDSIVEWLRARLHHAGARGFAVGLSGGLDSAVVARLCQAAAPANVVGVIMPCHSDPQDEADARLVADHFRIPAIRIDLTPVCDLFTATVRAALTAIPAAQLPEPAHAADEAKARTPLANVKPRLRMTTLYFVPIR
jgi:NAD+ synthase